MNCIDFGQLNKILHDLLSVKTNFPVASSPKKYRGFCPKLYDAQKKH